VKQLCAGVDVSAASLEVAWRGKDGRIVRRTVRNDVTGHRALIKELRRAGSGAPVRVAMEATGIYGLDLAVALDGAEGVEVMVANPRVIANFGKALLQRSKTDVLDAETILMFVERMPFIAWHSPSAAALQLRAIARRIAALTKMASGEKTRRRHAAASEVIGTLLERSARQTAALLEREIAKLRKAALALIAADTQLARRMSLLTSIKGIGEVSAVQILAELMLLPADMTDRQWVAHAGLDPRLFESGSSVRARTRISKAGNHYLRASLYLPALVASRYEPNVKAFREHLSARGKRPKSIIVAVMRKLLHAIHAMFRNDALFDGTKFYRSTPAPVAATSGIPPSAIFEVSSALSS